ncbi:hemoblobin-interacting domain-containing protein [Paraclostridium sordellii]|uniref:hemoblobin-interacting domain-containing protein n=1 Tax=Paraclostridium sordellii TaxID=1505 RepID=UPI001FAA756B|nr:hemoblobin-interacting domain-containing protein [Paeniclostridium sordellii]
METPESKNIVDRFELNTVSYDAVVSEDGTHINDFKDYLNAVKDASLARKYLSFDEYISSKNAKEYKNRPYNAKEVLQDNLLGQATSFRDILGLKSPNLEVQTSIMNEDMVLKCDDANYLNSIKAIAVNGDGREISKDLYSIEGDKLTINKKLTTGDKIKLIILATGYKDKVIESNLEIVLDKIDLKPEKEFKTGENVVITGLTHDFAKNIQSIKLDGKNLLTKEQGGYSSDTYYTISDDKLVLQSGLFKEAKQYNLEINGKYYGKKELSFNITESEKKPELDEKNPVEEKKELPKVNLKVESKPGFMKKYEIKFRNSGDWINNVTNVSVNGTFYKSGLSW